MARLAATCPAMLSATASASPPGGAGGGAPPHAHSPSSPARVPKAAYEPMLPLSVVVHIDYEKAPNVIQRFGDVKKLITQTLDPMLSAYFRDVAHQKTMLELLHQRDAIQQES